MNLFEPFESSTQPAATAEDFQPPKRIMMVISALVSDRRVAPLLRKICTVYDSGLGSSKNVDFFWHATNFLYRVVLLQIGKVSSVHVTVLLQFFIMNSTNNSKRHVFFLSAENSIYRSTAFLKLTVKMDV